MLEVQNAPQLFNLEEPIDLRSTSKERLQTLLTGITLILLTFIVGLKCNEPVERINNAVIALQVELLPKTGLSPLPIIVEVDEQSLNAYGQWPWPRYQVAHLLETIQRGGPAAAILLT